MVGWTSGSDRSGDHAFRAANSESGTCARGLAVRTGDAIGSGGAAWYWTGVPVMSDGGGSTGLAMGMRADGVGLSERLVPPPGDVAVLAGPVRN